MLGQCYMAIMATESATSSKKAESHESRDEREATRPHEVGSSSGEKAPQKPAPAEPETLDSDLDNPYYDVACTD